MPKPEITLILTMLLGLLVSATEPPRSFAVVYSEKSDKKVKFPTLLDENSVGKSLIGYFKAKLDDEKKSNEGSQCFQNIKIVSVESTHSLIESEPHDELEVKHRLPVFRDEGKVSGLIHVEQIQENGTTHTDLYFYDLKSTNPTAEHFASISGSNVEDEKGSIFSKFKVFFCCRGYSKSREDIEKCRKNPTPECLKNSIESLKKENNTCNNPGAKKLLLARLYFKANQADSATQILWDLEGKNLIENGQNWSDSASQELKTQLKEGYYRGKDKSYQPAKKWWESIGEPMRKAINSHLNNRFGTEGKSLLPKDYMDLYKKVFRPDHVLYLNIQKEEISMKDLQSFRWLEKIVINGDAGRVKDWAALKNFPDLKIEMSKNEAVEEEIIKQTGWESKRIIHSNQ